MKIAVDFDGTIVTHAYPQIGKPIPFAIETLKKLQREDMCQIILYTCREGQLLDDAVNYCKERGLEFYAVNAAFPEETPDMRIARKLDADVFIDDHNLGGRETPAQTIVPAKAVLVISACMCPNC